MHVDEFLRTVVSTPEGYFCLASKTNDGSWNENFFTWPDDLDRIMTAAVEIREHANVYFSSHLFREPRSLKELALPSRTLQADLDHADTATVSILPTVLVQTSPQRHQGFWVLDRELEPAELELHARRIAYGVPDCDRTGWTAGHKVRLPNTYNYKYKTRALVEIVGVSLRELRLDVFNNFPELKISVERAQEDVDWVDGEPDEPEQEELDRLLASLKGVVPAKVYSQYTKEAKDRSAALWAFNTEAIKAGMSREQTYWLALGNANNKFKDRYHGERDLRRDILRAESHIQTRQLDLKAVIMDMRRRGNKSAVERAREISDLVLNHMRENGEFVHAKSGLLWYLRKDTGRPVTISIHSEWMLAYLNNTFGLNATENFTRYLVHDLQAYCKNIPSSSDLQALSYFDQFTGKLMLHTGGRDVLHISKDTIEVYPNGYGSVVFQWFNNNETFYLDKDLKGESWYEYLFGVHLDNIIGMTREESLAVLRAWLIFLLFRQMATSRPILFLTGQQGSGKTVLAKKIYRLIFGRFKNISGLSGSEDFDLSVATQPFVAYDNLDTYQSWLPDALAASTSDTDIEKRKLYTDLDVITLRRQAMLLLTAHNPRFTREDVMDRMLMFMFQRLEHFDSESEMMADIVDKRNMLWTSIVHDVQKILATPKPRHDEAPQFRIEDFAYLGLWFSRAISPELEAAFIRAVNKIRSGQRSFNIEQDQLLVGTIERFVKAQKEPTFKKVDVLHSQFQMCAIEPELFKRTYRLPLHLSKKLWTMQDSLKTLFNIEWTVDVSGTRTWKIGPKVPSDASTVVPQSSG